MEPEKKHWEKPKLIVLVRGRPEVAVLGGCKVGGTSGPGFNNQCQPGPYSGFSCSAIQST